MLRIFRCEHLRKGGLEKMALERFFERKVLIQREDGWEGGLVGSENGFL